MRGYSAVGLYYPKNNWNIGGVLRAADCFGASMVAISGKRFRKACTDVSKSWKHIPLLETEDLKNVIPYGCVPVAIEITDNARCISNYVHPESAFYIFGPEDGSIGGKVLDFCRDVVKIPSSMCLNLASCVNVVLYDRAVKQLRK